MIQANELRIGNNIYWLHEESEEILTVDAKIIADIDDYNKKPDKEKYSSRGMWWSPIELTEENILKLRRVERDNFKPIEFGVTEPGERQIEKQYWSSWINDDYKIHLTPCYGTDWINDITPTKSREIKFWFIWYVDGSKHIPIMSIRQHKLLFIHQLQNLFQSLTGYELIYPS